LAISFQKQCQEDLGLWVQKENYSWLEGIKKLGPPWSEQIEGQQVDLVFNRHNENTKWNRTKLHFNTSTISSKISLTFTSIHAALTRNSI
jgi:hypothetical protein